MEGLNGNGKKLASTASALAADAATAIAGERQDGRAERIVKLADGTLYLRLLWRNEVRTLAVMRADRTPSVEEVLVAREAVGVPEGCLGVMGPDWAVAQDAAIRVPVRAVRFVWAA